MVAPQLSLLLMVSAVTMASYSSYSGTSMYRLTFKELNHPVIDFLRDLSIEVWGNPNQTRYMAMVPPKRHDCFEVALHYCHVPYQLLIPDVEKVFHLKHDVQWKPMPQKENGSSISFSKYYRYYEIRQYLENLQASFPDRVRVGPIGKTFEGRPLDVIQISSGGNCTRPVILIDAGIHAREWVGPAAALYVVNQLVENAVNNSLLDNVDWHIIPVLNPDGYEYTFTTDRMWRKTRSYDGSFLCRGVDANRNFDYHWNEIGTSDSSCGDNYAGQGPFSEPETRALRDYVLDHADRIKLYLTIHSFGGYLMYPWGYTSEVPDDWKTMHALAEAANEAQVAAGGDSFHIGSAYNAMYPVGGCSYDWVKGVAGVPLAYVIELPEGGSRGFDPPETDIIRIVKPFFEAIRVFGQYIAANYG